MAPLVVSFLPFGFILWATLAQLGSPVIHSVVLQAEWVFCGEQVERVEQVSA